jgi:photosystem II stability/assembly factor-like uncharacterized protein
MVISKKLISYLIIFIALSTISFAQWSQAITGMGNQSIGGFLADGDSLYAGSTFNVYKSTNQGDNWFTINNGLPSVTNFYSIVKSGNYIIAGGDAPGIWLSSNNGISWYQTNSGVDADEFVYSFFVDGNNVYAAIGNTSAIGVSTDNGNTWTKSTNGIPSTQYMTGVAKLGSTLFATHSALGVHTSTDNGISWALSASGGIGAQDKNAIVNSGPNLCVAATNGVWTSTDNGENWNHNLTTGFISGFGYDGTYLYAVGSLPPYRSSDNGVSWIPVDDNGLVSSINSTIQFTSYYAFINTFGIGVYRRSLSEITSIKQDLLESIPELFSLDQNYPNPFNPSTKIRFVIPNEVRNLVTLKVYDVLGNEIATLIDEYKPAGSYEVKFDASQFSSGIYFYKLQLGSFIETKKMILLR